jgi:hypothetical protein
VEELDDAGDDKRAPVRSRERRRQPPRGPRLRGAAHQGAPKARADAGRAVAGGDGPQVCGVEGFGHAEFYEGRHVRKKEAPHRARLVLGGHAHHGRAVAVAGGGGGCVGRGRGRGSGIAVVAVRGGQPAERVGGPAGGKEGGRSRQPGGGAARGGGLNLHGWRGGGGERAGRGRESGFFSGAWPPPHSEAGIRERGGPPFPSRARRSPHHVRPAAPPGPPPPPPPARAAGADRGSARRLRRRAGAAPGQAGPGGGVGRGERDEREGGETRGEGGATSFSRGRACRARWARPRAADCAPGRDAGRAVWLDARPTRRGGGRGGGGRKGGRGRPPPPTRLEGPLRKKPLPPDPPPSCFSPPHTQTTPAGPCSRDASCAATPMHSE